MRCVNCGILLNPQDSPWCDETGCYDAICGPASPEERAIRKTQQEVITQAESELNRAVQVNAAPEELEAVQAVTLEAEGINPGDEWRQPHGAHDAYPLSSTVRFNEKTWESLIPANVWQPGVSGWREVVESGAPDWVQPTGAHDAYDIGARVTFEAAVYESLINDNVWSPTAYPAGWQLIP